MSSVLVRPDHNELPRSTWPCTASRDYLLIWSTVPRQAAPLHIATSLSILRLMSLTPEDLRPSPASFRDAVQLAWLLRRRRKDQSVRPTSLALLADLEVHLTAQTKPNSLARSALTTAGSGFLDVLAHQPLPFMLGVFLVSWLPLSFGPALWRSDEAARDFLGNLWQVEAAAFGLFIAAALFLFEAYSSSIGGRYGISLQRYSQESGVAVIVPLLTAAILLTGTTLLGWGNGAPRGWAGALCLILALAAIVGVPRVFAAVARLLEPQRIEGMRRSVLMSAMREEILAAAKNSLMSGLLSQHVSQFGASVSEFAPLSGGYHPWYRVVSPGILRDINLDQLGTALKDLADGVVVAPFGRRIPRSHVVVYSTTNNSAEMRPAGFFQLDEARSGVGASNPSVIDELNGESLRAIREQDHFTYEKSLGSYEFLFGCMLTWDSQALAWYQRSVFSAEASRIELYEKLKRALWLQYDRALQVGNQELVRAAGHFPARLLEHALEASNETLTNDMIFQLATYAVMDLRRS
jgi:hypothetical protein